MVGRFKDYSDSSMDIIKLLCDAGAENSIIPNLTIPTSKEGCSCGRCIGGWLSPRMLHRSALCVALVRVTEQT